jgi:sugar phosphate isomerase/epimerase
MQIAISTGSLSPNTTEALTRAADLGFELLEINLQAAELDYGYRRRPNVRFYRELKGQLERLGLSAWSVTTPGMTQAQMFSARARKDVLMGGVGAAGILGGRVYVVEPADIFLDDASLQHYLQNWTAPPMVSGFDETWTQVVNRRITMAMRNVDYWMGAPLTNQPDNLARVAEDLAVGCALDIPLAVHRTGLQVWLDKVVDRLAIAYAYDLTENGQPLVPAEDRWAELLPLLTQTRLKCLVMHAGQGQSDDDIRHGRELLQSALT